MTQSYRAAIIGDPVTHSLSPVLHRAAYAQLGLDNWSYEAITVTAVYSGSVNLEAGVEGLVYGLAREHVLELGTYESRTLTRLDVLELYYLPELALKVEYQAVL